jgi:hypothetical protein
VGALDERAMVHVTEAKGRHGTQAGASGVRGTHNKLCELAECCGDGLEHVVVHAELEQARQSRQRRWERPKAIVAQVQLLFRGVTLHGPVHTMGRVHQPTAAVGRLVRSIEGHSTSLHLEVHEPGNLVGDLLDEVVLEI